MQYVWYIISSLPDRSNVKNKAEMMIALTEAQELATQVVDFIQEKDPDQEKRWTLALAIAYAVLSKATDQSLHQAMETVMTIYKNTKISRYEEGNP
jgi:3-keto-L-gulonate-6-phosphate decarboxylase